MRNSSSGWKIDSIKNLTESFDTVDPKKFPEQEFKYVDIGAIDNKANLIRHPKTFYGKDAPSRARRVIKTGDTLFSTVRTYLKNIALVTPEFDGFLTSTGVAVLRPSSELLPEYLFLYVIQDEFVKELSQSMDGTMYPAIRDSDILSRSMSYPSKEIQQSIVNELTDSFHSLELAEKCICDSSMLIDNYKRVSVRCAYTGETSSPRIDSPKQHLADTLKEIQKSDTSASAKKLHKVKALSEDEIAALPVIPSHWKWLKLGQFSKVITKGASPRWQGFDYVSEQDNGVLFVTSENVRENSLDLRQPKFLEEGFASKHRNSALIYGDVLVNIVGASIGRATVFDLDVPANINQAVALCRLVDKDLAKYVSVYLNSDEARRFYSARKVDVARANLSLQDISNIPIPICATKDEAISLVDNLDGQFSSCDSVRQALSDSISISNLLKQNLLRAAFTPV